jgi:hypothetical protein
MGVLCFCVLLATGVLRVNQKNTALLIKADATTVVAWGACAVLTFSEQELYKPKAWRMNLGLQLALVVLYAVQYVTRSAKAKGE